MSFPCLRLSLRIVTTVDGSIAWWTPEPGWPGLSRRSPGVRPPRRQDCHRAWKYLIQKLIIQGISHAHSLRLPVWQSISNPRRTRRQAHEVSGLWASAGHPWSAPGRGHHSHLLAPAFYSSGDPVRLRLWQPVPDPGRARGAHHQVSSLRGNAYHPRDSGGPPPLAFRRSADRGSPGNSPGKATATPAYAG